MTLDIGKIFERLMLNGLMRALGMIMRTGLILFGFLLLAITALLGAAFFIIWLSAPLVAVFLLLYGILRIFV